MYIILLIFCYWIICGFLSYNWQQHLYMKQFGASSPIVYMHFIFGPIALLTTFIVDYLKSF